VKETCNDIERQNILAKFPDRISLTLHRELNFSWGNTLLLLLTASGYVTSGSDTAIHNTILYTKNKVTHTHSKQYTTQKLQTQ
jgi:hypothetical protein